MAVAMNQDRRWLALEFQIPASRVLFFDNKFFKQERCPGHLGGGGALHQVRILVAERQNAARFTSDDRGAVLHECVELPNIEIRIFPRLFGQAFRNHRPAAASPFD